jgi:heme/copper-type cytochrome/quinol oxidase subunit 1
MHYVIFSSAALGGFAAIYYWFPKWTGKKLNETLGKIQFWIYFIGGNITFFVQHDLGLQGMPRRIYEYDENQGWIGLNQISTIGAFLIGIGTLLFFWNVWRTLRHAPPAGNDPWDAQTLEWATTSPPPERNFDSLPPIRSERPWFDAKYPDAANNGHAKPKEPVSP